MAPVWGFGVTNIRVTYQKRMDNIKKLPYIMRRPMAALATTMKLVMTLMRVVVGAVAVVDKALTWENKLFLTVLGDGGIGL